MVSSLRQLLLRLRAYFGSKAARRAGKPGGCDGEFLQMVFGQVRVEVGDLWLQGLPCVDGAVVAGAVALSGVDLRWSRWHIDSYLHHAHHGVVVVIQRGE